VSKFRSVVIGTCLAYGGLARGQRLAVGAPRRQVRLKQPPVELKIARLPDCRGLAASPPRPGHCRAPDSRSRDATALEAGDAAMPQRAPEKMVRARVLTSYSTEYHGVPYYGAPGEVADVPAGLVAATTGLLERVPDGPARTRPRRHAAASRRTDRRVAEMTRRTVVVKTSKDGVVVELDPPRSARDA
jgi:hypothetical protein